MNKNKHKYQIRCPFCNKPFKSYKSREVHLHEVHSALLEPDIVKEIRENYEKMDKRIAKLFYH